MSTAPRNCPHCGLINPPGTTRCDCGHNFDGPSLPRRNRSERPGTMADRPQGYAFGWYVACTSLAMSTNSALAVYGFPLDLVLRSSYLVVGLAAAIVRPWSWYALLASVALYPGWGGLYIALVASDWRNRLFVALATVLMTVAFFGYFYKRRAMFGAKGRWRRLEQWCPGLIGPQTHTSVRVPGFAGLSNPRRLFFVAILVALVMLNKVDVDEAGIFAVVILLTLLLFVRRIREVNPR